MCIHFTFGCEEAHGDGVQSAVRELEVLLRPFHAKPHWGKIFHAHHKEPNGSAVASISELYSSDGRLDRFKALCAQHDPDGKFRQSPWVRRVLGPF